MFEERYKALSSAEKKLFTSYVDELLFDSFIVRKKYDRVTGVSKISPTYLFIEKRIMDYYTADLSLATLQKSEQWKNLDAVKNKRVFYVDTGLWINNCSVFGKRKIMQQIEQSILDGVCPKTQ